MVSSQYLKGEESPRPLAAGRWRRTREGGDPLSFVQEEKALGGKTGQVAAELLRRTALVQRSGVF